MESTANVIKSTTERTELIKELVLLNRQYQQLFLKYENECRDVENLTTRTASLEHQNSEMKKKIELLEVITNSYFGYLNLSFFSYSPYSDKY